jgi:4-aminobutyrate aminotransferase
MTTQPLQPLLHPNHPNRVELDELAARPITIVTDPPGPRAQEMIARALPHLSPSLIHCYPLMVRRASGCMVEDVDGNIYLDAEAGVATASTGHCHPAVADAIAAQSQILIHICGTDFHYPGYGAMCEKLGALVQRIGPNDHHWQTFLTNSGTEAVEAAIKLSRYATGRQYLIGFYQSFHGRSMGSVTLTASKAKYRTNFGPMLPSVYHSFYGDFEYIDEVLFKRMVSPTEVAAIVVESWLGEGGYVLPPEGWFRYLRELCDAHGILLVCDEVQSGVGRSGTMWAIEQEGVVPDIVTSGKGIASGLPLGAMMARSDLMAWELGSHGSTYGGSPISCAAALATLDVIRDEGLIDNAKAVGEVFLSGLRDIASRHDIVTDVRGRALWIGVSLTDHETASRLEQVAFRKGLLVLGCGDQDLRISPPLLFREDQAQAALEILEEAVDEVEAGS